MVRKGHELGSGARRPRRSLWREPGRGDWVDASLEKIVVGTKLRGLAGPTVVDVVRVEWIGSHALNVVYPDLKVLRKCCRATVLGANA